MKDKLWRYLRHGKKNVDGWLQRIDAEIFGEILALQNRNNLEGGCVEIGVHQGKSFIPLCMALKNDEKALCIDLFDDQDKNLDSSGKGDFESLKNNIESNGVDFSTVCVLKGSSEDFKPDDILAKVGPVRFFSVDGGHWKSIVQNDLRLAEATLSPEGVIALDDYCRSDWPDVTCGYCLWQDETESDIVPFAIGSNKLYLCRRAYASQYRSALDSPFLRHYFKKIYRSDVASIDCYRMEPANQDEEGWLRSVLLAFGLFRPDVFVLLKRILKRIRK